MFTEVTKEEFMSMLDEHSCYYHDAVLCYADGDLIGFTKYDADGNLLNYWKVIDKKQRSMLMSENDVKKTNIITVIINCIITVLSIILKAITG